MHTFCVSSSEFAFNLEMTMFNTPQINMKKRDIRFDLIQHYL